MSTVVAALLIAAVGGGARLAVWCGPLARDAGRIAWSREGAAGDQGDLWRRGAVEGVVVGLAGAGLTGGVAALHGWPAGAAIMAVVAAGVLPPALLLLAALVERDDVPHRLTGPADAALLAAVVVAASHAGPASLLAALGWSGVVMVWRARARATSVRRPGRLPGLEVPGWRLVTAARHRRAARSGVVLLDPEVVAAVHRSEATARRRRLPAGLLRARPMLDLAVTVGARGAAVPLVLLPGFGLALHGVALAAPALSLVLLVAGQHASVVRLLGAARTWVTAPALAAAWGRPGRRAVVALCLPAVAAGWLVAAVGGFAVGLPTTAWPVVLALPPLVAWRQVRSAVAPGGLVLLSTPMGPMPVQTITRAVAGHDVALLAVLLLG